MTIFCFSDSPWYCLTKANRGASPRPSRNTGSWCDNTATSRKPPWGSMATSKFRGTPEKPGMGARSIDSKAYPTSSVAVAFCLNRGQTGISLCLSPTMSGAGKRRAIAALSSTPACADALPANSSGSSNSADRVRSRRCQDKAPSSEENDAAEGDAVQAGRGAIEGLRAGLSHFAHQGDQAVERVIGAHGQVGIRLEAAGTGRVVVILAQAVADPELELGGGEFLRLGADPVLETLGGHAQLSLHLRRRLAGVDGGAEDGRVRYRAHDTDVEAHAGSGLGRAVAHLPVIAQIGIAGADVAEGDAAALGCLHGGAGAQQGHVAKDGVGAEDAVVAAQLDRAHAGVAKAEVCLAHVDHAVLADGAVGGGGIVDADQGLDIVIAIGGRCRCDQAVGQQAIADGGALALAAAAERLCAQRQPADRVARTGNAGVVRIDNAADRHGPVACLDVDCLGIVQTCNGDRAGQCSGQGCISHRSLLVLF